MPFSIHPITRMTIRQEYAFVRVKHLAETYPEKPFLRNTLSTASTTHSIVFSAVLMVA